MNLFINHYIDPDPIRDEELQTCYEKNRANNFTIYTLEGRPTFSDFFKKINEETGDHSINIIANSDIYFDQLGYNQFTNLTFNICYALTRWDVLPDGSIKHHNDKFSQDVWVFRGAVKDIPGADFRLGIPGCDNKIAYLLENAGYRVINPSLTIKTYHLHNSGVRNYTVKDRLRKPFKRVYPCEL